MWYSLVEFPARLRNAQGRWKESSGLVRRAVDAAPDDRMLIYRAADVAPSRQQTVEWLRRQDNFEVLEMEFGAVHADPHSASRQINRFLGGALDVDSMAAVVDPRLYRQRS